MAHNLNMNNGKASMFYVGETPWHKLGTKLDNPATAEEAIIAAGLDYTVEKRELFTTNLSPGQYRGDVRDYYMIPGSYATVRADTHTPLGVVGARYSPIQNKDAFQFFDALVGEGEAMYHTAGALGKGERIWIMAKLPGHIRVGRNDIVEKNLLLMNSHDGSSVVRAKLTPIRVVCNNTLSAALSGTENEVRIRHTASATLNLQQAHKVLGLSNSLYDQLGEIFNRMSMQSVSAQILREYVEQLIPDNVMAESKTRTENIRNEIYRLHEVGQGADMARGTVWGLYNAVTEYTDHVQSSGKPDKALASMWFGGGETLKHKAFALATTLCN